MVYYITSCDSSAKYFSIMGHVTFDFLSFAIFPDIDDVIDYSFSDLTTNTLVSSSIIPYTIIIKWKIDSFQHFSNIIYHVRVSDTRPGLFIAVIKKNYVHFAFNYRYIIEAIYLTSDEATCIC